MTEMEKRLQQLVNEYVGKLPDNEYVLADMLQVSVPSVMRWKVGRNFPQPRIAALFVTVLEKELMPK